MARWLDTCPPNLTLKNTLNLIPMNLARSHTLFPELVPDRLDRAIQKVRERIWEEQPIRFTLSATPPSAEITPSREIKSNAFTPIDSYPQHWGRMFDHRWYRLEFDAADWRKAQAKKNPLWLHWREQAEATLYNEQREPFCGLDVCHQEARLPDSESGVFLIESIACRTAIWGGPGTHGIDAEGSKLNKPRIVCRNETFWQLWNDLNTARHVIDHEFKQWNPAKERPSREAKFHVKFDKVPPVFRKWIRKTNEALDYVDCGQYEEAHDRMTDLFEAYPQGWAGIKAILTGHAHIDLVWMWRESIGHFKAAHTFSTMDRLMDAYPEFRFAYSQPASYAAVENYSPALMQKVRERISQGRWEAQGATYVESDTQLACGEALLRSFVLGQEGFQALTGSASKILWLPDVFGYTSCLPQIMKGCGVDYFFTTKLTWCLINRFPHSSFRWLGLDGTEVLVHLSTGGNGYNCNVAPEELARGALDYRQADVHDEFLLPCGYGDGGGGITAEALERARRLRKNPLTPECEWGRIDTFFEKLNTVKEQLPAYKGELYLEYHRGVQTTHGALKSAFRRLERALQVLEAASCLKGQGAIDRHYWERLVFAQFHDYIPGSSIPEVYQEHIPELNTLAENALEEARCLLTGNARDTAENREQSMNQEYAWFNALPYPVTHIENGCAYDIPACTWVHEKNAIRKVAGDASASLSVSAESENPAITILKNKFVSLMIDDKGYIGQLEIEGTPIRQTEALGRLALYPDQPAHFDAWDIDYHALYNERILSNKVEKETFQDDFSVSVVCFRALSEKSSLKTIYCLKSGERVVRITHELDWHETEMLLKTDFPTQYKGHNARYGCPFGSVVRSQTPGKLQDEAQWEVPGSRYAIVSDGSEREGLFVVTEAKYGFSCYDGNLQVSLVRSPEYPEKNNHPHLRPPNLPAYTDEGSHTIELAIGLYNPQNAREYQPFALADTLYTQPVKVPLDSTLAPKAAQSIPHQFTAGNSLHLAWIKPVDATSYVLRFNEILGNSGDLLLDFVNETPEKIQVFRVDMLDRVIDQVDTAQPIAYRGFEILSFKVSLK